MASHGRGCVLFTPEAPTSRVLGPWETLRQWSLDLLFFSHEVFGEQDPKQQLWRPVRFVGLTHTEPRSPPRWACQPSHIREDRPRSFSQMPSSPQTRLKIKAFPGGSWEDVYAHVCVCICRCARVHTAKLSWSHANMGAFFPWRAGASPASHFQVGERALIFLHWSGRGTGDWGLRPLKPGCPCEQRSLSSLAV